MGCVDIKLDQPPRVETGPVRFTYNNCETDWAGVFLRGDDCFRYTMSLGQIQRQIESGGDLTDIAPFALPALQSIIDLLSRSDERNLKPTEGDSDE